MMSPDEYLLSLSDEDADWASRLDPDAFWRWYFKRLEDTQDEVRTP